MKRAAFIVLAVFVTASAWSGARGGLSGQDRSEEAQAPIRHQVTVTLKLIQVFVADAGGRPAMDLEKSDFVLYDNGKLQTISDFERHILAGPAVAGPEATAKLPPAQPPPAGAEAPGPLLARKFIFLIDYKRNELEGIKKAKTSVLEFIDTKTQPGDEIAFYTFSAMGRLKLHEDLTTDRAKVRAAVEKLRDFPGITPAGDASLSPDHLPMGMDLIQQQIFGQAAESSGPALRSLFPTIAQWAKVLRAIPGQKNLILYSMGFGRGVVRPGDPGYFAFKDMAQELASANVRVFSVNTTTGMLARLALGVAPEDSMESLAHTTGGNYYHDVNFSTKIAAAIQDTTASYYVLGFAVPAVWDGKYHEVKVEVRRKGYEVRAQRGYFNPVPFAKLSAIEKHVHLLGLMGLVAGEDAAAKRVLEFPLAAIPFAAAVPFATAGALNTLLLAEVPVATVRETVGERAELVLLVMNADKAIVDGRRLEVDWKAFTASGRAFLYVGTGLTAGRYECRAVLRNLDDGRAAVGACSVDMPALTTEGPLAFPPLLFVRGPQASYLNIASEKQAPGAAPLSISSIFPFPAKEYVPLIGALERGTTFLGAVLRFEWRSDRSGEIELEARLRPEGGGDELEIDVEVHDRRSEGEADLYLLGIDIPELPPGRYRLEIAAENTATGQTVRTSAIFVARLSGAGGGGS